MVISNPNKVTITFLPNVLTRKYPTTEYLSEKCVWCQNVSAPNRQTPNCLGTKIYRRQNVLAPKYLYAKMSAPNRRRQNVVDPRFFDGSISDPLKDYLG